MNFRWLKRDDGNKVLQEKSQSQDGVWLDVVTVHEKPQPREFTIYRQGDRLLASESDSIFMKYDGKTPPAFVCKTREVME